MLTPWKLTKSLFWHLLAALSLAYGARAWLTAAIPHPSHPPMWVSLLTVLICGGLLCYAITVLERE